MPSPDCRRCDDGSDFADHAPERSVVQTARGMQPSQAARQRRPDLRVAQHRGHRRGVGSLHRCEQL
jgi:hypothetical protein